MKIGCFAISACICSSICASSLAASRPPTSQIDHCSYSDLSANKFIDGSCALTETKLHGHFAYILKFTDGFKVSIEYLNSQSGHHVWKIDDQMAMGYEISRAHLVGATLDLKQIIEWGREEDLKVTGNSAPLSIPQVSPASIPMVKDGSAASTLAPTKTVSARSLGAVPGAIICADQLTVQAMFRRYSAYWEATMRSRFTKRQSELIEGSSAPPDWETYGCTLVAPGTAMLLESNNIVPVVTVKLKDGKIFRGVTLPMMYGQQ